MAGPFAFLRRPFHRLSGRKPPAVADRTCPRGAKPGFYNGKIILTSGDWEKEVALSLNVWNFSLPEKSSIRSSFGLPSQHIKMYHNLETREELEKVMDLYFRNLKDHRVCPTSPLELYPMKVHVSGVYWKGGEFVTEPVHGGQRALKIADSEVDSNVEARYEDRIPVEPNTAYKLSWYAKTEAENQDYTVLLEFVNAEGICLPARNVLKIFKGSTEWKPESLEGMGTGSFYSRTEVTFAGFKQGTPEYDRHFGRYLSQVQDHLEKNGWLGKEYIYWFDEPEEKDYPFVREGMNRIRKGASKLTRFITEHQPGHHGRVGNQLHHLRPGGPQSHR